MSYLQQDNSLFHVFEPTDEINALAKDLTFSVTSLQHPLILLAANKLQDHLLKQKDWIHNFGLTAEAKGMIIGKMFGVLIVRTRSGELGYLSAFSGKLAGKNHHPGFVPPVFDNLAEGGFLTPGMIALGKMTEEIKSIEKTDDPSNREEIKKLKLLRRKHSNTLQNALFDQYYFINRAGIKMGLMQLFAQHPSKKPSAGAGECAAPKLLQYAFLNQMEPLALAEFWWGQSPKSATWKHGHFYPPCREKCEPILMHMLSNS